MIKKLMTLGVILSLTFCASSQTLKDSSCPTDNQLRIALMLVEKGRQDAEELKLQKNLNGILYDRISNKDSIINDYKIYSNSLNAQIKIGKDIENNLIKQADIFKSQSDKLFKQLKWQKTKTWIVAFVGAVGIVVGFLK